MWQGSRQIGPQPGADWNVRPLWRSTLIPARSLFLKKEEHGQVWRALLDAVWLSE